MLPICLLLLVTMNGYSNFFRAAEDADWFDRWQADSDAHVIDKIEDARLYGVSNHQGLMPEYHRQLGLQAYVYSLADALLGRPDNLLEILRLVNSLLMGCVVVLLALWFYLEYGTYAAVAVALVPFFSGWLTVGSRNLYWVLWTFFAPFLWTLYLLRKPGAETRRRTLAVLAAGSFLFCGIRFACGFEFCTVVLVAMELPVLYYAWVRGWRFKTLLKTGLVVGLSGLLALGLTVSLLMLKLAAEYGGWQQGAEVFVEALAKTSNLTGLEAAEEYRYRLHVPARESLQRYLEQGKPLLFGLRMRDMLTVFFVLWALTGIDRRYFPGIEPVRKKLFLLGAFSAASFAAPLSWYLLANGHSAQHFHINYILWLMPCVFLVAAFAGAWLGVVAKADYTQLIKRKRNK